MSLPAVLRHKFSHIYIEEEIASDPETERICSFFPDAIKIYIHRYTDVFERNRQSLSLQQKSQNLILGSKHGERIYQGSPVCQNFDERYFYYCAPTMNCLFDCEYCWLKGMYPSSNLVVFVNQNDFLKDTEKLLAVHPVYLCVCYETDLLGMESMLGYGKWWGEQCEKYSNLTIELRTKAPWQKSWDRIPVNDRVIIAFTLSPQEVIDTCEHGTASLHQRLAAVNKCMQEGRSVRLCFDPMIPIRSWKDVYHSFIQETAETIDLSLVHDVSIGTFRISKQYLKNMRRAFPDSQVIQYPYICENGFYHLPDSLQEEMEGMMKEELGKYIDQNKIFLWKEQS